MKTGLLTGIISAGVLAAGAAVTVFTPVGKKVRKEFVNSTRNVKLNLEKKADGPTAN